MPKPIKSYHKGSWRHLVYTQMLRDMDEDDLRAHYSSPEGRDEIARSGYSTLEPEEVVQLLMKEKRAYESGRSKETARTKPRRPGVVG